MADASAWVPDHQLHVVATLAHIDGLIARAATVLESYLQPGPLSFEDVRDGATVRTQVKSVAPLPEAISRYVADALNQMRSALEHTIFAEVEYKLGHPLPEADARGVEMPATTTWQRFDEWSKRRPRANIGPLARNQPLWRHIRTLQPFHRRDSDQHPMRILAAYTNATKHRGPALATTQLGAVMPDDPNAVEVFHPDDDPRPLSPGDVVAAVPLGTVVGMSAWPSVAVKRPHTGTWHVTLNELGYLEQWVRTVAVPTLILGRHDVGPIPPNLDIEVGHADLRQAMTNGAAAVPAATRSSEFIQASSIRPGVAGILAELTGIPRRDIAHQLDAAPDRDVIDALHRLRQASSAGDIGRLQTVAADLVASLPLLEPEPE